MTNHDQFQVKNYTASYADTHLDIRKRQKLFYTIRNYQVCCAP
jgi:hypothetical protein